MEKNEKKEFKLPIGSVRSLGQQYQLQCNRLSYYLNFPTGGSAAEVTDEEGLKTVLDTILYPGNIAVATVMQRQQGVKNLTLCIGTSGAVAVGMDETEIRLSPVEVEDFTAFLSGFFDNGTLLESLGTMMSLRRNGLYTLLAAADLYEVNRLMALLEKKTEVEPLTDKGIKGLAATAITDPDPRQLTTSVLATDRLTAMFDVDMGISELCEMGIFEPSAGGVLKLTKEGQQLVVGLSEPEILTGIRSYYYDEGMLTEMGLVIWRTRNYLWGIELIDQPSLFSMDFEKVFVYLQSLLSRGDYSDGNFDVNNLSPDTETAEVEGPETQAVEAKTDGPDQAAADTSHNYCAKCGAVMKVGNKFCTICGTPVSHSAQPRRCPSCQASVEQNAKFCKKCGRAL